MKVEDRRRLVQLASGLKPRVSGVTRDARAGSATPETRATRVSCTARFGSSQSDWAAEDWVEHFHERARLREMDEDLPRSDAERLAFEDTVSQWLALHPAPPTAPQAGCVYCGKPDDPHSPLLPVLAADHGHTWLHDLCHGAWVQRRRAEAREALEQCGSLRRCQGKDLLGISLQS